MPNIESAKKRVKVNQKKYTENRSAKSELGTAIKKFKAAIFAADLALAEKLFPVTASLIDSAAAKGIIHKNNASGKVSDISKLMRDLRAGKITAPVVEEKRSKTKPVAAKEEKPAAKEETAADTKTKKAAAKPVETKAEKPAAKKAETTDAKPAKAKETAEAKPVKAKEATVAAEEKKPAAKKPAAKKETTEPKK